MEVEAIDWEKLDKSARQSITHRPSERTTDNLPTAADDTTSHALFDTLSSMRDRGVKFLYGRWLVEGGPTVLLFDTGSVVEKLNEWKTDLWNLAGIPTPSNDTETNETILFGYLVAWFLGEVSFSFPFN